MIRPTEPTGSLNDCVEHRLQLSRRTADDIEHLARRGLKFERLAQLALALLLCLKQPRVLDGYDCLVGEGLKQRNLFLAEWVDHAATKHETADGFVISQERRSEERRVGKEGRDSLWPGCE